MGLSMESSCDHQGLAQEQGRQEGILLSLESHKAVPAPFLTKTYQLVDDPSTDHIVSWGDDHATFVVWRPPEFARDLLPNYFKHNNFSSFVRQLNTYGFRKIVPERWEFANEYFRKGEKHLLCEIHRRKTSCASSSSHTPPTLPFPPYHHQSTYFASGFFRPALSSPDSDELPLPSWCDNSSSPVSSPRLVMGANAVNAPTSSSTAAAAASALFDDNERLRRSNAMLLSELAHMRKLYNDIIYFVQNHVQPVAPSSSYPASLLLAPHPSSTAFVQKFPSFYQQQQQHNVNGARTGKGYLNSSSTTSSSSLTIADEPSPDNNNINNVDNHKNSSCSGGEDSQKGSSSGSSRPKLFGVTLGSSNKKRPLHPDEQEPASPSTKPRFVLSGEDLGFHLMPPSTCITHS